MTYTDDINSKNKQFNDNQSKYHRPNEYQVEKSNNINDE